MLWQLNWVLHFCWSQWDLHIADCLMFASIMLWFVSLACGGDCQLPQSIPLSPRKNAWGFSWHEIGGLRSHLTTPSQIRVPFTCVRWWNCLEFPPSSYYFPQLLVPIMVNISNALSHTGAQLSKSTLKSWSLKWSRLKAFYEGGDCGVLFVLFQVRVFGVFFWFWLRWFFSCCWRFCVCVCVEALF